MWYESFAKQYNKENILACALDHGKKSFLFGICFGVKEQMSCFLVGHGLSEGKRCYIDKFEELSDDVVKFASDVRKEYPDIPMFVLGHSLVMKKYIKHLALSLRLFI